MKKGSQTSKKGWEIKKMSGEKEKGGRNWKEREKTGGETWKKRWWNIKKLRKREHGNERKNFWLKLDFFFQR